MEEWGQPLVIDLSWFKTMQLQQQKSLCLRELPYSTSYNKSSIQPFHLHYTGVQDPKIKTLMKKVDPQLMSDERPEVYTEQSYLDIFPKENIVYLSPDSRNELKWDDEDVYVIGGLVDVDLKSNASLGKDYNIDGQNAPEEGIKAPKSHPRGGFFWNMIFIILKNSHQNLSNEVSNFILGSLEVCH